VAPYYIKGFFGIQDTTTEDMLLLKHEIYLKIPFVQRSKHAVSMIDTNQFVLQGGSHETQILSVDRINTVWNVEHNGIYDSHSFVNCHYAFFVELFAMEFHQNPPENS
jgi:hypothetical protein